MKLTDIVKRTSVPAPWAEGDNIPWSEPGFSERMLKEHLTQDHDLASRKLVNIDRHVAWIHENLLGGIPACILDLGCGPGLYMERLARLGHACTGVDFSPASLAYARRSAEREGLALTYIDGDLRQANFGPDRTYDLVMQIFGEINIFSPADVRTILRSARSALKEGGTLLLEVQTAESVRRNGAAGASWFSSGGGLFSASPHILLEETFWDESHRASTTRYYVINAETGEVTRFASTSQAYTQDEYATLLRECGFDHLTFYPSLAGSTGDSVGEYIAVTARR